MKWISVMEKLPEINKNVIILNEKYGHAIAYIKNNGRWEAVKADWESGIAWIDEEQLVSYWMPLPDPPNKSLKLTSPVDRA